MNYFLALSINTVIFRLVLDNTLKAQYEKEIRDLRKENQELKKLCETKDKRINLLEAQLKSKQQKYSDDLKILQRRIAELQIEIGNKADSIVYLTSQISKRKVKPERDEGIAHDNCQKDTLASLSPSPPHSTPRRHSLRRRNVTSPAAANMTGVIEDTSSHHLIASDYVLENSLPKTNSTRFLSRYKQSIVDPPRPAVGHSQVKRERDLRLSGRPKPSDYEDFIRMTQSNDVVPKSIIEPLPPITTRSGRQLTEPGTKRPQRSSRTLRSNKAKANAAGEVETLCIDNTLTSPERQHRVTQDSSTK